MKQKSAICLLLVILFVFPPFGGIEGGCQVLPLTWSTYYGQERQDGAKNIAADNNGNIYVAGYSESTNPTFIQNPGGGAYYQPYSNGTREDVWIAKFSPNGNRIWATFFLNAVSTSNHSGLGLHVNGSRVYVVGFVAASGFPIMNVAGAYNQPAPVGGTDGFITLFDTSGVIQWSTFFGGSSTDYINDITTDAAGNVVVTGWSGSANLPVINPGGGAYYQPAPAGSWDAFIAKFDAATHALTWCTYFGGAGQEIGQGIATDLATGDLYITGTTTSTTGFPLLNPGGGAFYQPANAGQEDMYIAKFNAAGTQLWGTYYGGSVLDFRFEKDPGNIMLVSSGSLYIRGYTESSNFPTLTSGQFYDGTFAGISDAFLLKFNTATNALTWATFTGGNAEEGSLNNGYGGIASDAAGAIYVTGVTNSTTFPTFNPGAGAYYQPVNAGFRDAFIMQFSAADALTWSTYYGGGSDDWGTSLTINPDNGCLYVTGEANGTGWNTLNPGGGAYYQTTFNGIDDSFILKFCSACIPPSPVITSTGPLTVCTGDTVILNVGGPYSSYLWNTGATTSSITAVVTATAAYSVTVTDSCGTGTDTITVTVLPSPTITITGPTSICSGQTVTLSATGGTSYVWNTGQTTTAILVSPTANTNYSVIVSTGSCSDTAATTVTVSSSITATVGPNSTICTGTNITLTASGGSNYSWSNGATTTSINVSPTTNTTYSVIVSSGSCSDTTTATVTVNPLPSVSVSGNTTICAGDVTTLTASGGINYSWNTGATTSVIIANPSSSISYTVVATNSNGCSATTTINVTVSPPPTANVLGTTICAGQTATLTASGGGNYSWNNGVTTASINVSPTTNTTYSVVVSIGTCTATASATVTVNPNPVANAASNVTITQGQNTTLTASGGGTYSWSNGMSSSSIIVSPAVTTVYCVTVTNANNCTNTACVTVTVRVELINCPSAEQIYLPNAFSPNRDGENDILKIYYSNINCIKEIHLVIYNRWGEKVFETSDPLAGWDGYYKGKIEGTAVFVYYMRATLTNGEKISKKGNVSLIR